MPGTVNLIEADIGKGRSAVISTKPREEKLATPSGICTRYLDARGKVDQSDYLPIGDLRAQLNLMNSQATVLAAEIVEFEAMLKACEDA